MATVDSPGPRSQAAQRAGHLTGLLWHLGVFVIVNACFWLIDLAVGRDGPQWAIWITVAWGFALAFHALAYLFEGRGLHRRTARRYVAQEPRRDVRRM